MRRKCAGIILLFVLAAALAGAQPAAGRPRFSFGVLADIQYADKDPAGQREYRKSMDKLQACVADLRSEKLEFVIQLGDLVDGGLDNLDRILPVFNQIAAPRRHVLGNHDFSAGRGIVLKRLGLRRAYYQFRVKGWRFVVLDGMDLSVAGGWPESSAHYRLGRKMLDELQQRREPNANTWNGAVGDNERAWLRQTLQQATARGERVVVVCHFPALAASCRPDHLLWDHREIVRVLDSERSVVAYLSGHDHRGGYAAQNGIHYLTLPGMVEAPAGQACKVVDVYDDRLVVRTKAGKPGTGSVFPIRSTSPPGYSRPR
jgi:3',5'-cyclic AMP phosphodiesterase CpdA